MKNLCLDTVRRVDRHQVAGDREVLLDLRELLHLLGNGDDSFPGLRRATGHSFERLPNSTGRRCRNRRLLQHHTIKLLLWLVLRRAFVRQLLLLVPVGGTHDFAQAAHFLFIGAIASGLELVRTVLA